MKWIPFHNTTKLNQRKIHGYFTSWSIIYHINKELHSVKYEKATSRWIRTYKTFTWTWPFADLRPCISCTDKLRKISAIHGTVTVCTSSSRGFTRRYLQRNLHNSWEIGMLEKTRKGGLFSRENGSDTRTCRHSCRYIWVIFQKFYEWNK